MPRVSILITDYQNCRDESSQWYCHLLISTALPRRTPRAGASPIAMRARCRTPQRLRAAALTGHFSSSLPSPFHSATECSTCTCTVFCACFLLSSSLAPAPKLLDHSDTVSSSAAAGCAYPCAREPRALPGCCCWPTAAGATAAILIQYFGQPDGMPPNTIGLGGRGRSVT